MIFFTPSLCALFMMPAGNHMERNFKKLKVERENELEVRFAMLGVGKFMGCGAYPSKH